MKTIEISIDEKYFNLLWRSLAERENELISAIEQAGEGSDDAPLIGNDLTYLRLCKKDLEEKARAANFSNGVFSLEDEYTDLSDM